MDKLLPCPFCGGEASYEYSYDDYNHDCIVCHNDECGASLTCWPYEGEKVTAAWNRRVDDSGVESLQIPDGTCEAAEEETPSDWTKNKACRDAVLKTFGGES